MSQTQYEGPHGNDPEPPDAPGSKGREDKGLLGLIEKIGNKLPDPAALFAIGAVLVIACSALFSGWEVQPMTPVAVVDAETGGRTLDLVPKEGAEAETVNSMLTRDGFYWAIRTIVDNFINFAPLGVVLVGMLGIGVAEKTGLLATVLKVFMLIVPRFLLTPTMLFLGIMSSLATDAGYVVLPPLAAALYASVGRSPLAGLAAVFAGVAAGFNANLVITGLDPLLARLTQVGANLIEPDYAVSPSCNWLFMIASTFVITGVGWVTSDLIVEKRLRRKPPEEGGPDPARAGDSTDVDQQRIKPEETRALGFAAIAAAVFVAAMLALILIPNAPLQGRGFDGLVPEKTNNLKDFFPRWIESIVPLLFFGFVIPGIVYGAALGKIKNSKDAAGMMIGAMADMAPIIVLAFFAGQFIAYFGYSNLDTMLAMSGGQLLFSLGLPSWSLIIAFILLVGVFNLFVGSMSAKYTLFAPIFVPMLMLVGIAPELTQAAYRVGDSVTNIITPLNAYLVIVLVFMRKYVPKAGMGTLIATMLPYSLTFLLAWTVMIVVWMTFNIPLGLPFDTGPLFYEAPTAAEMAAPPETPAEPAADPAPSE